MVERRIHPRFFVSLGIEVRFESWSEFRLVYTNNISKGGMSLNAPEPPAQGATLILRLQPPTVAPILAKAIVRHVAAEGNVYRVGVEFTDLDEAKRTRIEELIERHRTAR